MSTMEMKGQGGQRHSKPLPAIGRWRLRAFWSGDGKGIFTAIAPTWINIAYAALVTGDINGDGFPDIVVASHFGRVQILFSDGKGGVSPKRFFGDQMAVWQPSSPISTATAVWT
jgi:hypothetical protein